MNYTVLHTFKCSNPYQRQYRMQQQKYNDEKQKWNNENKKFHKEYTRPTRPSTKCNVMLMFILNNGKERKGLNCYFFLLI